MGERLTNRVGAGVQYDNGKYTVTCYPQNDNLTPVDKMAVKLCEFEDGIEKGTTYSLPCKVGTIVYAITLNTETFVYGIHRGCIASFNIRQSGISMFICHEGLDYEPEFKPIVGKVEDFGISVFFTREEAETELAERKKINEKRNHI